MGKGVAAKHHQKSSIMLMTIMILVLVMICMICWIVVVYLKLFRKQKPMENMQKEGIENNGLKKMKKGTNGNNKHLYTTAANGINTGDADMEESFEEGNGFYGLEQQPIYNVNGHAVNMNEDEDDELDNIDNANGNKLEGTKGGKKKIFNVGAIVRDLDLPMTPKSPRTPNHMLVDSSDSDDDDSFIMSGSDGLLYAPCNG